MRIEQLTEFLYSIVVGFLMSIMDDSSGFGLTESRRDYNRRMQEQKRVEIVNYFHKFIHYLKYNLAQETNMFFETIAQISTNLQGIGTNAGNLHDHKDSSYYRSHVGKW